MEEYEKTPELPTEKIQELLREVYGFEEVNEIKELNSYDDRNYFFKIPGGDPGYILKITNSVDSKNIEMVQGLNSLMLYTSEKGLLVSTPIPDTQGNYCNLAKEIFPPNGHAIRVLKYIPGRILYSVPIWTTKIFYQLGEYVGKMTNILRDFRNEALKERKSIWQLKSVAELKSYSKTVIEDDNKIRLADSIIDAFILNEVFYDSLEHGIIHGDVNDQNIIVSEEKEDILALIDFGDSHHAPLIFELAVAIMYCMVKCTAIHPNEAGGHVIAGYLKERILTPVERKILKTCVAGRYAQSLILGALTYKKFSDNEYVLLTAKNGWKNLAAFWEDDIIDKKWESIIELYNVK